MKLLGLPIASFLIYTLSFAQEASKALPEDSLSALSTINLDDVVITGQYEPQSLSNSVYRVKVIDLEQIQAQGANSLNEVLSNELNIRLSRDLAIGNSSLQLQGIGGNNVKILIDGIPVAGRNGNGNDVDLTQINLQNVEKIEWVEGPMAVNFGANALAGVVNIMTQKNSQYKTSVHASIQEETAGNEYGLKEGKHIQFLQVDQKLSDHWYLNLNGSHTDFQGYQGTQEGRQKEWNPKEQYLVGGNIRYSSSNHKVYYKVNYLDENILNAGQTRYDISDSGTRIPYAFDEEYASTRLMQHLQIDGKLRSFRYSITTAYSNFSRVKSMFSKNLQSGDETLTTSDGDQDTSKFRAFVSRSSITKAFGSDLSIQIGHDFNLEKTSGGRIADSNKAINDYGFYTSLEWLPFSWLKLRPGLRYAINSVYETPLLPSLNVKLDVSDKTYLRLAYGRGYRSPTARELFFEFVDSNHRIFGNTDLEPEYSHHIDGNISKTHRLGSLILTNTTGVFYNDIENLIAIGQSEPDPTAASYVNIHEHKTLGFNTELEYSIKNISGGLGLSYTGRYNRISETDSLSLKKFFWSPEINSRFRYSVPGIRSHFNLFYKYNGTIKNYVQSDDNEVKTGEREGYHWMDLTITKHIAKNFTLSTGVKNLLNVTRLDTTSSGGAHSGGSSVPVSYGRSYFLKVNFNLNIE